MSINALINELKENNEDFEFYPTTKEMIRAIYKYAESGEYLDIGCGTCNFKKYFEELSNEANQRYNEKEELFQKSYTRETGYNYDLKPKDGERGKIIHDYYVIEKSRTLLNKLDKETIVLGTDFYSTMLMDKPVKNIFCNPPYSEFEEWSERIIRESNCQTIFLIIPVRWKESEKIKKAIEESEVSAIVIGTYDFLNAERNARAKVDILKISKREYRGRYNIYDDEFCYNEKAFDKWFDDTFKMRDKKDLTEWEEEKIKKNNIKNKLVSSETSKGKILVDLYNEEMQTLFEHFKAISSLDVDILETIGVKKEAVKKALKKKSSGTKARYWKTAFDELDEITERLTSDTREKMLKRFVNLQTVDFNIENIYALVLWTIKNANTYYNEQLIDFFKELSSPDNVKPFKSNQKVFERDEWRHNHFKDRNKISRYTLDYRIIMSSPFRVNWNGSFDSYQREAETKLKDIFVIARNLGFKIGLCDLPHSFGEKCTVLYEKSDKVFMEYRAYKNGNMHVKFDIEFAKALNVEVSRLLGWIRSKEDIKNEFPAEMQGAEKYFKTNYTCIGSTALMIETKAAKEEETTTKYTVENNNIKVETNDIKYMLDVMNIAINGQKETQEIHEKCLNVLKESKQFLYRQIIVTVEETSILLSVNNKKTIDKIIGIIEKGEV